MTLIDEAPRPIPQWLTVDEGWGRRAVEFATLLEPAACREYAAMHHHLDVRPGERLVDIACGSGLALELAAARGARVAGIDASPRLVEVARDRVPGGDVRVGDMADLPWDDASFDVVTSFRGLWATTIPALTEARRVLRPGGRISVTTWGHVKVSPGFWALAPFSLAAQEKVRAQADMKSLGRPGVGEAILAEAGFVDVRRHRVPFAWEFADPEEFARALASAGPAYEAIQQIGEAEFHRHCVEIATERVRAGLPLRAEIDCVGFTARLPSIGTGPILLGDAPETEVGAAMAAEDVEALGFVANVTRLWMHDPALWDVLFDAVKAGARGAGLSIADRAVATVVATTVAGDTYCPLVWGDRLGRETSPEIAVDLLRGAEGLLDDRSRAIAAWARTVVKPDPARAMNGPAAVERLREVGFTDAEILRLTLYIALRVAFSTVNGALGARPEREYVDHVAPAIREAWQQIHGEL